MVDGGPGVRERRLVATLQISETHTTCKEARHGSQILGSNDTHILRMLLLEGRSLPLTEDGDSLLVLLPPRGRG